MKSTNLRGNEVTRPALPIDTQTDEGRGEEFKHGAIECLRCAKVLQEHAPNLVGEYILAFHAIEPAFKAFLASAGYQMQRSQWNTATTW
jgi:hypothetical protein